MTADRPDLPEPDPDQLQPDPQLVPDQPDLDPDLDPDLELLAGELQDLFTRADPVPAEVLAAGRSSFGWRDLTAELALLTADSLVAGSAVRGDEPARLLSFQAGDWTIEIEVSVHGGRLRVLGQLVPPRPARLRADHPGGSVTVAADPLGRFAVRDLPPGPTRFACQPLGDDGAPAGVEIHSQWQVL